MPKTDKRVDAYIAKAQPFAQPVLKHLRELVHKACPKVEETIKWGFPNFDYKGVFCSMAGFNGHCAFNFWKQSLLKDSHKIFGVKESMGHLGRISSLKDLPSDKIMIEYLKEAVELNDKGVKREIKKTTPGTKELVVPEYMAKALSKNKKANTTFSSFSYSHRKEYVEWITEAKTEETRNKRLKQALEWMAEGKSRNWKYTRDKK